jgi:hypothetical protein
VTYPKFDLLCIHVSHKNGSACQAYIGWRFAATSRKVSALAQKVTSFINIIIHIQQSTIESVEKYVSVMLIALD